MQRVRVFLFIVVGILCVGAALLGRAVLTSVREERSGPVQGSQQMSTYLAPRLMEEVSEFNGRIGIALYDMDTGEKLVINGDEVIRAASLIKVPIMLEFSRQLQDGRIRMDQRVTYNAVDQTGGFGKVQSYPLGTRFQLSELLTWMITISDNDATRILMRVLRPELINRSLAQWGCDKTQLRSHLPAWYGDEKRTNYTTASEMLKLFRLIFDRAQFSPEETERMVRLLEQQTLNDEMPRYLPKALSIGHKTGLLGNVMNDAGIVTLFKRHYILCILSEGRMGAVEQSNALGRISRLVYNYFSYNRGPFLLGGGNKRRAGVLLLAGQAYAPTDMKDLAERLYAQGYAVYCLPLAPLKKQSPELIIKAHTVAIQQGLALLQQHARDQYVVCSSIESLYFLNEKLPVSLKSLVIIPDPRSGKFLRAMPLARAWMFMKRTIHVPFTRSFWEYTYLLQERRIVSKGEFRRFTVPATTFISGDMLSLLRASLPDGSVIDKRLPRSFERWSGEDLQNVIAYMKEKRAK